MKIKRDKARIAEWTDQLRELLPPGSVLDTFVKNVSASGMSRSITVYHFAIDGKRVAKHWLSYRIAAILDLPWDDGREAIRVHGAGMDMGFHIVYELGRVLYPDGFTCPGERCPSNEHNNPPYPKPRRGMKHRGDGGYALRKESL